MSFRNRGRTDGRPQPTKSAPFTLTGSIDEIDGETGAYKLAAVRGRMGKKALDGEGEFWVHANERTQVYGKPKKGQPAIVIGVSRCYEGEGRDGGDKWLSFPNTVIVGEDAHASIAENAASA